MATPIKRPPSSSSGGRLALAAALLPPHRTLRLFAGKDPSQSLEDWQKLLRVCQELEFWKKPVPDKSWKDLLGLCLRRHPNDAGLQEQPIRVEQLVRNLHPPAWFAVELVQSDHYWVRGWVTQVETASPAVLAQLVAGESEYVRSVRYALEHPNADWSVMKAALDSSLTITRAFVHKALQDNPVMTQGFYAWVEEEYPELAGMPVDWITTVLFPEEHIWE